MIQRKPPPKSDNILPRVFFLFLIFMVAVSGTFLALNFFGSPTNANRNSVTIVTVEIIITATPDPSQRQITVAATNRPGQVDLPDDLAAVDADATIDPAQLDAVSLGSSVQNRDTDETATQSKCIFHSVVSGDTVSGVAQRYGVNFLLMLEVNNLTVNSAVNLQIGDTLLVPLEGCNLESQSTETVGAVDPPAVESSAESAQIQIVEVEGMGDITAEGIRLRNTGGTVNLTGWILSDAAGNSFSFPELMLFPDAQITLYTRSGTHTPDTLFWGKDQAVWQDGDVLTLADAAGQIQATIPIVEAIDLE